MSEKEEILNETLYKNYYDNKIYTKISIGSSNTQIDFQIKFKQYSFCVRNDTIYDYTNSSSYINNEEKYILVYNIDFRSFLKSNVPLLAIVPRLSSSSFLSIPTPLSMMVIVLQR